jgi:hypothetical protein
VELVKLSNKGFTTRISDYNKFCPFFASFRVRAMPIHTRLGWLVASRTVLYSMTSTSNRELFTSFSLALSLQRLIRFYGRRGTRFLTCLTSLTTLMSYSLSSNCRVTQTALIGQALEAV